MAANARRGPSASPTSSTPKFCSVSGTGVKGKGRVTRARSAANRLALITTTVFSTADRAIAFCGAASDLAKDFIIPIPGGSRFSRILVVLLLLARVCRLAHMGANSQKQGNGRAHYSNRAEDQDD